MISTMSRNDFTEVMRFVLITEINEVSAYKPINSSLFPKFG